MSDHVSIRAVVEADLSALADLLGQLRYDVPQDELQRRLEKFLTSPGNMAFVSEERGRIHGLVHV